MVLIISGGVGSINKESLRIKRPTGPCLDTATALRAISCDSNFREKASEG